MYRIIHQVITYIDNRIIYVIWIRRIQVDDECHAEN
jgi:hypothetical protein